VLSLLISAALSQAPALQALEALERQTVPLRRPSKLLSAPAEALLKDDWNQEEATTFANAATSTSTRSIVLGLTGGALLAGGTILTERLEASTGVWVGVVSSVVSLAVFAIGALWVGAPTTTVFSTLETRDRRLRHAARSTSEWHPAVVRATSQLLGFGDRDGRIEFVRDDQVVNEEQLAQLSANPAEHVLERQRDRGSATAAAVLLIGSVLVLCAPPVILGATDLPPLPAAAVSLGAVAVSLVMLLIAQPLATAAATSEAAMVDRFNAAVFNEARKELARTPNVEPLAPAAPPPVSPAQEE